MLRILESTAIDHQAALYRSFSPASRPFRKKSRFVWVARENDLDFQTMDFRFLNNLTYNSVRFI